MSLLFTNNTTNKVTVTAAASINNLAKRTIMVWLKLNSYGVVFDTTWYSRGVLTFADVTDGTTFGALSHYGGVGYNTTNMTFDDNNALDTAQIGTWMHVALSLDTTADNEAHLYINGVDTTGNLSRVVGKGGLLNDSATNLLIGSFGVGQNAFTIDGKLYDFRLYNEILDATQLSLIVSGGYTVDPLPLNNKCHLSFASSSGSIEPDLSGNSNVGVITGAVFSSDNPPTVGTGMTLSGIRSQVQTYLLNTSSDVNSLSWTETELNSYINEAILYTQQVTLWHEDWDVIQCKASVSNYSSPDRVYQFKRLTWDRQFLPQTNEYELDKNDPSWRLAQPNNPYRFYFPQMGQQYTISPYPTPIQDGVSYTFSQETGVVIQAYDTSAGDGFFIFSSEFGIVIAGFCEQNYSLVIFRQDRENNPFTSPEIGELVSYLTEEMNLGIAYVCLPDTLVQDTDTPQLPVQCQLGLVFYTLMKCFMREGEFQDLQLAQQWFIAYGDWLESVLENKYRWWSTRVTSLEPFEPGSLFSQRLNSIGYPLSIDLKPSY